MKILGGILVGGLATRMGGHPKGLLRVSGTDHTIVEGAVRALQDLGADVVLLGRNDAYAGLALPALPDAGEGQGPAAGLLALLEEAGARGATIAVVVSCDAPFVRAETLAPLVAACAAGGDAAAYVEGERWMPLPAAYVAARAATVLRDRLNRDERSLHGLLDALAATKLVASPATLEALRDWDRWDDVER